MVRHRILITLINMLFPPLAVLLIAGGGWDCILNCIFFLLGVLPSHIHGFYVTCTYFHRKRKVRKGRYPGGPKSLIESRYVLNGGASDAEVDRLWRNKVGLPPSTSSSSSPALLQHRNASRRRSRGRSRSGRSPVVMRERSRDHGGRGPRRESWEYEARDHHRRRSQSPLALPERAEGARPGGPGWRSVSPSRLRSMCRRGGGGRSAGVNAS